MILRDGAARVENHRTVFTTESESVLDKKAKKRAEVLKQKLGKLQQQLAGARKQEDEPGEVRKLEEEITAVKAELEKLKAS